MLEIEKKDFKPYSYFENNVHFNPNILGFHRIPRYTKDNGQSGYVGVSNKRNNQNSFLRVNQYGYQVKSVSLVNTKTTIPSGSVLRVSVNILYYSLPLCGIFVSILQISTRLPPARSYKANDIVSNTTLGWVGAL